MINVAVTLFSVLALLGTAPQERLPQAQEIAAAVLPLPDHLRNGAAVVRVSAVGIPEPLRKGTNGMVCIADRPGDASSGLIKEGCSCAPHWWRQSKTVPSVSRI